MFTFSRLSAVLVIIASTGHFVTPVKSVHAQTKAAKIPAIALADAISQSKRFANAKYVCDQSFTAAAVVDWPTKSQSPPKLAIFRMPTPTRASISVVDVGTTKQIDTILAAMHRPTTKVERIRRPYSAEAVLLLADCLETYLALEKEQSAALFGICILTIDNKKVTAAFGLRATDGVASIRLKGRRNTLQCLTSRAVIGDTPSMSIVEDDLQHVSSFLLSSRLVCIGLRGASLLNTDINGDDELLLWYRLGTTRELVAQVPDSTDVHHIPAQRLRSQAAADYAVDQSNTPSPDSLEGIARALVGAQSDTTEHHRRDPFLWVVGPRQ